jgi:hypothetical protein
MLASYADETGHAKDPDKTHLGLAGILAESDRWSKFDTEWRQACNDQGVILPFHMTDFAAFQEQFSVPEWRNESKRQALMRRLLDAIERTEGVPIGSIVNVPEFNALREDQRIKLGHDKQEPYYVAFQGCTQHLAFAAALKSYPPQKVSMVYAKLKKFTGVAEQLWYSMQEKTFLGQMMGSFTRDDPGDCTPLQAADLWAYELGHHFQYILPNSKKWRYPFRRLVAMGTKMAFGSRFFTYFGRLQLLEILGEFPDEPRI